MICQRYNIKRIDDETGEHKPFHSPEWFMNLTEEEVEREMKRFRKHEGFLFYIEPYFNKAVDNSGLCAFLSHCNSMKHLT